MVHGRSAAGACIGLSEQGLEDLLGGEADLAGDGDGGEVIGVDFVGAQLVGDVEGVEEAGCVGFGGLLHPAVSTSTIWPLRMWRVLSARGSASLAWWVVMTRVREPPSPSFVWTGQVRKSARSSTM